ncbi:hypothetical protein ANN_07318 [Periplaneta americana]|uniref:Uncharacterized protein n=1 Tax=Periplaneta americana TaxID=6978 RepID=A0ABQ8SZQ3_PERAM|nr:hypothetical protein ANN_07318 [Periplaneta americana]
MTNHVTHHSGVTHFASSVCLPQYFCYLEFSIGSDYSLQRENTGILLEASKEIGVEVNPEKTKYMIMSRDQNIVRNGNIKIGNLSFEEVEKFKYLGATVTNINDTREEIKHRINMGNACYYSVEKLLSSGLLLKNLKVIIYKTVILPVVLYGCETWTLTLIEEHRLRVFENKVLRKIFGAKRDEVTGEWRKLHNTELHALYSSLDIIRNIKSKRLKWVGHIARMGESRNAYRVLVGRPEGKRPLGRPRRRWEDNIKMDLREVGYDDREWINLAQDRDRWRAYVRAAMNLRDCFGRFLGFFFHTGSRHCMSREELLNVQKWTSKWLITAGCLTETVLHKPVPEGEEDGNFKRSELQIWFTKERPGIYKNDENYFALLGKSNRLRENHVHYMDVAKHKTPSKYWKRAEERFSLHSYRYRILVDSCDFVVISVV